MKNIEIKALIIAIAITTTMTGLFMYIYSTRINKPIVMDTDKTSLVKVVVALADIKAKEQLTEKNTTEINVPKELITSNSATDMSQVLGKIAKENIYKDEEIRMERLLESNENFGLSTEVPNGFRAISLKIDALSSLGGKVTKGDAVDIFVFLKPPYVSKEQASTAFQNIKVIDTSYDANNPKEYVYLTMCMSPEEAEKLFFLDSIGDISLVLRNISDDKNISFPILEANNIK